MSKHDYFLIVGWILLAPFMPPWFRGGLGLVYMVLGATMMFLAGRMT